MELRVFDEAREVASAAADVIQGATVLRPDLVLALPTGRTPIDLYDELASRHARGDIDLSRARAFNLDELILPSDDPRTFRAYMRTHAWGRTGLAVEQAALPDGEASDLEAECRRYEMAVRSAGGIELAILGLGVDGHVAYNLPGPVTLETHIVRLPDSVAAALDPPASDLAAITMGLGTIRSARAILLLATGASKAQAVRALAHGGSAEEWPCTFLRDHAHLQVFVDRPAAGMLDAGDISRGQ